MSRYTYPAPPPWSELLRTVGVTGTNGKTTVVTWIARALRAISCPVGRVTTVGSFLDDEPMGLPDSYAGFVAVMRACADRGGRAAAIELTSESLARGFGRAWPCSVGVFTNLTHDHLDAHRTFEHYLASKAQLFVNLLPGGTAVLNACDPVVSLLAEVVPPGAAMLAYGVAQRGAPQAPPDLFAKEVRVDWDGSWARLEANAKMAGCPAELRVRGVGAVFAENGLAALTGAVAAGVPAADAARAIETAPAPPGRFELVHRAPFVVVDFAHSPDAIERVVGTARELCSGTLTVVMGAGGNRDSLKRGAMGAAARKADRVIVTTDNPRREDPARIASQLARGLEGHPGLELEPDRARAIGHAVADATPHDVVLILGKGHERGQIVGSEVRPFSDVDTALEALRKARQAD